MAPSADQMAAVAGSGTASSVLVARFSSVRVIGGAVVCEGLDAAPATDNESRYTARMEEKPGRPKDRYDTSGNPEAEYVDDDKTILINKPGITELEPLQLAEEHALAKAYEALLGQVRIDTPLTCELLRHIHRLIFGELYEWAGRWRTVWIRKPGITWPPPDFVDQSMQMFDRDILARYPAAAITDDDQFCAAAAEIQGEFLTIHPFREGNARTIKLLTDLLAAQTGRPLLAYDQSNEGRDAYIAAAKTAFSKDYSALDQIIRRALEVART